MRGVFVGILMLDIWLGGSPQPRSMVQRESLRESPPTTWRLIRAGMLRKVCMTRRVFPFVAVFSMVFVLSGCNLVKEAWGLPQTLLSLPKTALSLPGDVLSNPQGVLNSIHEAETTVTMPPSEVVPAEESARIRSARE